MTKKIRPLTAKPLSERERLLCMHAYGYGRCEALNGERPIRIVDLWEYCLDRVSATITFKGYDLAASKGKGKKK